MTTPDLVSTKPFGARCKARIVELTQPLGVPARVVAKSFWTVVLCAAIVVFAVRLLIALSSDISLYGTIDLIILIILIYGLFLLEGLQHCAIQINDADSEGVSGFISKRVSDGRRDKVGRIISKFQKQETFELFLTGRNMCSMIAIVMIAYILDKMPFSQTNMFYSFIDRYRAGEDITIDPWLHSFIVIFVLSTLLPCWLAQLLPQLLADKRSVEFIQMPGSVFATQTAIYVARLETGWPSDLLYSALKRVRGGFALPERFGVGKSAVFERVAELFGMHIEERTIRIEIKKEELIVSDESAISYHGKATSNIRHSVRLPNPPDGQVKFLGWGFQFPRGTTHDEPETKILILSTAQALEGEEPMAEADLLKELVVSFGANLQHPIPREGENAETVRITAKLRQAALKFDSDTEEAFYLSVSRPTKVININIETFDGIFLTTPAVNFDFIDEASGLGFEEEKTNHVAVEPKVTPSHNGGWDVSIVYPPLHSRFKILLDAHLAAKLPVG